MELLPILVFYFFVFSVFLFTKEFSLVIIVWKNFTLWEAVMKEIQKIDTAIVNANVVLENGILWDGVILQRRKNSQLW